MAPAFACGRVYQCMRRRSAGVGGLAGKSGANVCKDIPRRSAHQSSSPPVGHFAARGARSDSGTTTIPSCTNSTRRLGRTCSQQKQELLETQRAPAERIDAQQSNGAGVRELRIALEKMLRERRGEDRQHGRSTTVGGGHATPAGQDAPRGARHLRRRPAPRQGISLARGRFSTRLASARAGRDDRRRPPRHNNGIMCSIHPTSAKTRNTHSDSSCGCAPGYRAFACSGAPLVGDVDAVAAVAPGDVHLPGGSAARLGRGRRRSRPGRASRPTPSTSWYDARARCDDEEGGGFARPPPPPKGDRRGGARRRRAEPAAVGGGGARRRRPPPPRVAFRRSFFCASMACFAARSRSAVGDVLLRRARRDARRAVAVEVAGAADGRPPARARARRAVCS